MKQYEIPLLAGEFYHIYNRGIDGTNLFYQERNYSYFLEKYAKYMTEVVDTYAYCLLGNHFHLLIRVKDQLGITIEHNDSTQLKTGLHNPDRIVSKKFSDFFNSYSKSINNAQNRTGGLFETPFKRLIVSSEEYLTQLIWYIHFNPQKHGFVKDFRQYPHSSYNSFLSNKPTKLFRDEIFNWFGNKTEFEKFHISEQIEKNISQFIIEMD